MKLNPKQHEKKCNFNIASKTIENIIIRNASISDLEAIHHVEKACFPSNQAATLESFRDRLKVYPHLFWLIEENGKKVGIINGMVTNYDTIHDTMYKNVHLHDEDGLWQSVLGLAVLPECQNKGYAGLLIKHLSDYSLQKRRKGIVLTCEEHLISFYIKFGFINKGISNSVHGGDVYYDMQKPIINNL